MSSKHYHERKWLNITHCLKCGKELTRKQRSTRNKFCGYECAGFKRKKKKYICLNCFASFKKRRPTDKGMFCCRACCDEYKGERRKPPVVIVSCPVHLKSCNICKRPFVTRRTDRLYCSNSCRAEQSRRTTKQSYQRRSHEIRQQVKRLDDKYLIHQVANQLGISRLEVTQDMIEWKRAKINLHRGLKKLRREYNEYQRA